MKLLPHVRAAIGVSKLDYPECIIKPHVRADIRGCPCRPSTPSRTVSRAQLDQVLAALNALGLHLEFIVALIARSMTSPRSGHPKQLRAVEQADVRKRGLPARDAVEDGERCRVPIPTDSA